MTTTYHARTATAPPLSMPPYSPPGDHLSQTTRYLCSAAFLVPGFADAVADELIGESRRSVPPSHGFDLDPVIRQCLRARGLRLAELALLTALYLLALRLSPEVVLLVSSVAAMVHLVRRRLMLWALLFSSGLTLGTMALAVAVYLGEAGGYTDAAAVTPERESQPWPAAAVLLGMALVVVLFRRHEHRVVTREFAPGVPGRRQRRRSAAVEERLEVIAGTQRGNVVVHHDDPFLGCGPVRHGWSLSLTLRPKSGGKRPVAIDPVALNERLKEAIGSMRAPWLPESERVSGISVRPYVVADGVRDEDDPLLDPESGMPYTMAGEDTLDAIVANPQGGLRQYLRVVIPVRGKDIRDSRGRIILGAQALGISVNMFVHVAVEGGMLYAETIGTVLPPLRDECRLADALRPEKAGSYALGQACRTVLVDVSAAPYRLLKAVYRVARLRWAMHRSQRRADEFRTHDYGARMSVRELASTGDVDSYLQKLDGIKYVKLVDRIVGETIIDFLVENGVDPLEFRQAVSQITLQNSSLVQIGTVQGGQNNFGGDHNTFTGATHA
jgi:hypothetical protein